MPSFVPLLERLNRQTEVAPNGICIVFTGHRNSKGYGELPSRNSGRSRFAHRVAYELLIGPIPDGLQIDHLCRNTSCVNVDHLEPVTPAENKRRAKRERCPKGHGYTGENTYVAKDGSRSCRTCHREQANARARAKAEREGRVIAVPHGQQTHCPNGHPYDRLNTGRHHGARRCLACHRAQEAERSARRRREALNVR